MKEDPDFKEGSSREYWSMGASLNQPQQILKKAKVVKVVGQ
jgi:hypothetical protein